MAPGTRRGLKQTVSISCLAIFGVKCNTFKKIMAGMETWETISLVAIAKQVPGVGYMAAQLQQENPFTSKNPRTYSASLVRRSVSRPSHKAYFSSSFRRKTGSIRPTSSAEGILITLY